MSEATETDSALISQVTYTNPTLARLFVSIIRSPRLRVAVEAIAKKIAVIDAAERGGADLRNYTIQVGVAAQGEQVTHFACMVDPDGGSIELKGGGSVARPSATQ